MRDYNVLIQNRVDKSFNIILGIAGGIAFIAAIILWFADFYEYAILNCLTGLALLVFFIFAKKLKTIYKIFILIIEIGQIAIASYIGGGFDSAFLTLLIITNIIAVLFLNKRQSMLVSAISVMIVFSLVFFLINQISVEEIIISWGLHLNSFVLLLFVLHISSRSIKGFLIENIEGLEDAIGRRDRLVYYDTLTGLPNTSKFKLDVNSRIKAGKIEGYILLFNLRSLSLINTTHGESYGDQALVKTGTTLEKHFEKGIVARVGGNEFAVYVDHLREEDLIQKFGQFVLALKAESIVLNKKLEYFAAYNRFNHRDMSFDTAYQKTALTLTYAKDHHINDLISYNDKLEASVLREEAIKEAVGEAIRHEHFKLYYQPKIETKTEIVSGVEALARWYDPVIGTISPNEFIPIIEALNLSIEFGNFVIERACMDYAELQKAYNQDITVSVNISPSHIVYSDIVQTIKSAMTRYSIPEGKLIIEITEDIMIEGIKRVKPILNRLRSLGARISLDDFGSGYSSLNYVTQLVLDEMKIDKSFIDQITSSKSINILLESIMDMAEKFNVMVVAEGVETMEQKNMLDQLGCHLIQGYLYAKPEPLEEI